VTSKLDKKRRKGEQFTVTGKKKNNTKVNQGWKNGMKGGYHEKEGEKLKKEMSRDSACPGEMESWGKNSSQKKKRRRLDI